MTPLRRNPVNKYKSANSFKRQSSHTKAANINGPQRGGWRF